MIAAVAFGVSRTWIAQDARIDALAVVALLVVGTFRIGLATNWKKDFYVIVVSSQQTKLLTFDATYLRIS